MRVYVPLTLPALREAHRAGELAPDGGGTVGYAVTPGLRAWCGSEDGEELEYEALGIAARASLRLLAGEPETPRRRVVVALDVADGAVSPGPASGAERESPGEVRIEGPLPVSKAAAVHVDADDAEGDVTAAAEALAAAGAGDEAASGADGAEDHELLWYATQEIPHLTD